MEAIRTEGLGKRYGRRGGDGGVVALEDLTVAVHPGEIFGFLGPNGAGKSTMIRLLLGFLHPTAGRAEVLGLDAGRDSVEIRRRIGYLPGGIALYDGMAGADLLDYLASLYERPAPMRAALTDRLELSARDLGRLVRDYSRGMRQKIGIVQALQHDPDLAILDEPTEGLDPLMQRTFYDILDDRKSAGRTTFLSSHVLSEVERVCDRVAIVRAGRLVALEEVAALLARRKRHVEMRVRVDGSAAAPGVAQGSAASPAQALAPALADVPGVSGLVVHDGLIRLDLDGDVAPFLAAIGGADVTDLTIEPAHLEEAFLEFYADDHHDPATDSEPATAAAASATVAGSATAGGRESGAP